MSTDLAIRATARELAAAFAVAEQEIRHHFAALVEIERKLNLAFLGTAHGGKMQIEDRYNRSVNFAEPDKVLARIRRHAWKAIVDRLELRKVMSTTRWQALEKQLDEGEPPPIDEETVYEFARAQRADFQDNLVATIVEVYEWLRPRSRPGNDYVTNSRTGFMEIGKRVILTWMVELGSRGFRVRYGRSEDQVDALDRVFLILDGQGALAKVDHHGDLWKAIYESPSGHVKTKYFEARCHKNGTMHLHFLRPDLLAKLNKIAGGKTLRVAEVA